MKMQTFWKWFQLINSSHISRCYFTDTVEKNQYGVWQIMKIYEMERVNIWKWKRNKSERKISY